MPFITGDTEVLLIDTGPEAEEHRWMLVGELLYVVVRFWREFFERYAPPVPPEELNNRGGRFMNQLVPFTTHSASALCCRL